MSDTEEIERPKFMNYFKTFSIFDRNKFDEILVHLTSYSLNYGLTEDDMTLVTKVSFEQNLGFMQMRKLIHCLLPRRYCTKQTVETVLEYLLFNKYELPSLLIKVLLQWFIGIIEYNLVESKNDINDFYHMFVSLMKHNNIYCVSATELVYLLTNPDDVTRGFTMDVLKLYKTRINNKHYAALLFLFKCYRPDVVPERLPVYSVHKVFGPKSSVIFKRLLYAKARIQIKNNLSPDSDNVICNKFGINMKKKFSGIQLIPAMTLPIDNAKKINNLILSSSEPNCVMSLLNNVTGAFILEFGTRITQERFSYQLYFVLYDVFLDRNCNVYYAERDRILEKVAMFQNVLKLPIPVVSKFIGQFLLTWDGYEHDQKIYNLMEWLYVKSFTELQECVLNYLMDIFMTNKVETKCKIINCLGNLTVNIITTYIRLEIKKIPFRFLNIQMKYDFHAFIKDLYEFLEHLCFYGIHIEKNHPALLHTVLIIHENILMAGKEANIDFKIFHNISYAPLFSTNSSNLNGMCRILNTYPECVSPIVIQDFISTLLNKNDFDLFNRNLLFNTFDDNKIISLKQSLYFGNHPALISFFHFSNAENDEELFKELKKKFLNILKLLQNK